MLVHLSYFNKTDLQAAVHAAAHSVWLLVNRNINTVVANAAAHSVCLLVNHNINTVVANAAAHCDRRCHIH